MCLVPIPPALRDTLRVQIRTTLWAASRLGDTAAESALHAQYTAASLYDEKARLTGQMAYAGSRKCLDALVRSFTSPLYNELRGHPCRSLAGDVVKALGRLYPDDEMVTRRFSSILCSVKDNQACNADTVKQYTADFIAWAKKKFNVEVPQTGHPRLFQCPCGVFENPLQEESKVEPAQPLRRHPAPCKQERR